MFLQRVIGFDTVDDESKVERRIHKKFPYPRLWDLPQSPPYSYWLYYMFANMASLNNWRRIRGFSASGRMLHRPQFNADFLRYLRVSTSLRRSWRYRPSHLRFSHISFNLSWDTATQGSGSTIPLLSQTDWHCNEPLEQQRSLLDVREEPVTRFLQDRIECFLEYGRSSSVSFHQGN